MVSKSMIYTPLFFVVSILSVGCSKRESAQKEESIVIDTAQIVTVTSLTGKAIGLVSEPVALKKHTRFLTLPAKVVVAQDNDAFVGSLISGRVCNVVVKLGDRVAAGQTLMFVEGLEIGEIKARYATASAEFEFAKSNLDRQKKLLESNVSSQRSLLEAQMHYDKAMALFGAEKSRIKAIGLSESDAATQAVFSEDRCSGTLAIKSPLSGIVVERNVVIGQLVDGGVNAFRIVNLSSVCVDAQVYEKDLDKCVLKSSATFSVSAYPAEVFAGIVTSIGQIVDEQTHTLRIRAELKNPFAKLKPSMFGELTLPVDNKKTALIVPAEALLKIDNADCVFIQTSDSTFEKRVVMANPAPREMVEILQGIRDGEKVVVKGAFYLKSELLKSSLGGE